MDWKEKWKVVKDLPEGAQGKVFQVLNNVEFKEFELPILRALESYSAIAYIEAKKQKAEEYLNSLSKIPDLFSPSNHGALKVLHKHEDVAKEKQAEERIKREIKALKELKHPNLLEIFDHDDDYKWFVSRFYPNGSLTGQEDKYRGKPLDALRIFRPFVDGISQLHHKGQIHRDIKPQNVFIDSDNSLILGDLGLVFDRDDQSPRLSLTGENVGNWEYQPEWTTGRRDEDPKPSFDVFSLGKLLWKIISGEPIFRLWFFDDLENDLELLFPEQAGEMRFVNELLAKCMVRKEEKCLIKNGTEFLKEIDNIIEKIENKYEDLMNNPKRLCQVCGKGTYRMLIDNDPNGLKNFGFSQFRSLSMKILTCTHCGHTQIFSYYGTDTPDAWK